MHSEAPFQATPDFGATPLCPDPCHPGERRDPLWFNALLSGALAEAAAVDTQPIKIAILAMGGEGGGVLADWIVDLGEHNGHIAQTTSVPGVAQRTGATIYYVELFPRAAADAAGLAPVLALMPLPGDVDVVLASELMEAGRAVQRGLVTPDRTTLIASTHRVYAIAEKIALGDGRSDAGALLAQVQAAAKRFVGYDMAQAAERGGSVISAVLFGALAGARVLPFERGAFEATIARGGVGVQASLAAFSAACERAAAGGDDSPVALGAGVDPGPGAGAARGLATDAVSAASSKPLHPEVAALLDRARREHGGAALAIVTEGLRRLIDYQDPRYAGLYLDRLATLQATLAGRDGAELITEAARHLALWMSYEDTVRVADLKTRDSRFARVRDEVRAQPDQLLAINEYMHPRLQEIADTLPAALGGWLLASGWPRRLVERLATKGRVVQTSSLRGYLLLSGVAGLRRWRRGTLRYAAEQQRIEAWWRDIAAAAEANTALALEIVRCQRLVKGYGDTHERGLRNFALLRAAWTNAGARPSPTELAQLRDAALADEHGHALRAALQRLAPAQAGRSAVNASVNPPPSADTLAPQH
jgi:indolepyruvate ferredoxin oxidoreductase beta subunit